MDIAIPVNEYVWSFIQFYKKAVEKGADFMGEDLAEEADLVWEIARILIDAYETAASHKDLTTIRYLYET
ncbi:MAG: hypothetical protein LBE74_07815 [Treponema sp.]|jgi:hypothetical protein|nr:hypothetical protein [Treponema sp.]